MMNKNKSLKGTVHFVRQAVLGILVANIGALFFAVIALGLSFFISNKVVVSTISFLIVAPLVIKAYLSLHRNDYRLFKEQDETNNRESMVLKSGTKTNVTLITDFILSRIKRAYTFLFGDTSGLISGSFMAIYLLVEFYIEVHLQIPFLRVAIGLLFLIAWGVLRVNNEQKVER